MGDSCEIIVCLCARVSPANVRAKKRTEWKWTTHHHHHHRRAKCGWILWISLCLLFLVWLCYCCFVCSNWKRGRLELEFTPSNHPLVISVGRPSSIWKETKEKLPERVKAERKRVPECRLCIFYSLEYCRVGCRVVISSSSSLAHPRGASKWIKGVEFVVECLDKS